MQEESAAETVRAKRASRRRTAIAGVSGVVAIAVLAGGVMALLGGDKNPPRKVPEITVVRLLPPPPPPPPPPPQKAPEQPTIEQAPVKQEMPEEKPVEKPPMKEAKADEPPPGPLGLDQKGEGPGDLFGLAGRPGGRGLGLGNGGGGGRFDRYSVMVQTQLQAAISANPKTRNAVIQVTARLWADAMGRIVRVQLVTSTGDPALDDTLNHEVLTGLLLPEPPPKDMPMPIVARITERHTA
jgi:protein TonB